MWLDDSIRCVFSLSPRADGTVPETPLGQKTPVTQHELKMRRQGHYVILPPTNLLNVQSGQKSFLLQDVWRWRQICTNVRINNQWKGLLEMGAEHVKSIQTLYSNDCRTTFKDPNQVSSLNCGQRPFVELADAQPIRDIPFNMMVL